MNVDLKREQTVQLKIVLVGDTFISGGNVYMVIDCSKPDGLVSVVRLYSGHVEYMHPTASVTPVRMRAVAES